MIHRPNAATTSGHPARRHSAAAAIALLATGAALGLGVSRSSAAPQTPNRAQAAPSATVAPVILGTAREGSRLGASTGSWAGSPTSFAFQWERCSPGCTPISGATGSTYALAAADVGGTVKVSVTATNADGSTAADSAASATVAAAPAGAPRSSAAPAVSGLARQGTTLSTTGGSWTGTGNTYAYRWLRCNTSGGGCSEIASATKTTYTPSKTDVGATIRAQVIGTNASGSNVAVSSATAAVAAGTAPSNTKQPSISGTPKDNSEVEADPGTWAGDTPLGYGYQWLRCDSHGDHCTQLSGKTGKSYEVRSTDEGHTLRVEVTATNGVGSATVRSGRVTVAGGRTKPQGKSRPTISGGTGVGQVLKANHGSWSGTDPIDFHYSWLRCDGNGGHCSTISDAGGRTYVLRAADAGHRLRVVVRARNAAGTSDWTSGPTHVVSTGAPVNTRPPAATGPTQPGSVLTATKGAWSSSTSLDFSYQWSRCTASGTRCAPIAGATHRTYVVTGADIGNRLVVQVKAQGGNGVAYATSRPTVVVAAAAPRNASPPTVAGAPHNGSTLSATLGTWSSQTALSFFYQWARCDSAGRNCVPIPGATRRTYAVTGADVGRRLIVQVKAQSSGGTSYANSQPTGVVSAAARPPAIQGAVPVNAVSLPDRLVIDRVVFSPRKIRSRQEPLVARFRVSDTRSGRPVSGALVYAVGVPFNRLSGAGEVQTDSSGWATVTFHIRPTWPLKRGYLVVIIVRARKPGGSVLAGVSTRRFTSVRVG